MSSDPPLGDGVGVGTSGLGNNGFCTSVGGGNASYGDVVPLSSLISTLIDSLQPAFRSSTTEAMKAFAEKFFAYPYQVAFEDAEIVLYGTNGKHGLFKAVGRTSFTGSLRNSSAYALELLARLVSQQTNPHSHNVFLAVAQTIDEKGLDALRLNDHLKHGHELSTKDAALRFINLLKTAPVSQKSGQLRVERRVVTLREAKEAAAVASAGNGTNANGAIVSTDQESAFVTGPSERRCSAAPSVSHSGVWTTTTSISSHPNIARSPLTTAGDDEVAGDEHETKSQKSEDASISGLTPSHSRSTMTAAPYSMPEAASTQRIDSNNNQPESSNAASELKENGAKSSSFRSALKALKTRLFNRESREDLVKKSLIKDELFGRDLIALCDLSSSSIQYVDAQGVPKFLTVIINHITRTREVLNTEGIFRIPGTPEGTLELKQIINSGKPFDPAEWDVHAMTGVVKQWLRELPTPLIPFELYDPLIDAFKSGDASQVRQLLGSIASPALDVLRMIIGCLATVSIASSSNGMTDQSLSIVMAPNLFRPKVQVYAKMIQEMPATIGVVQLAIRDHISGVYIGEIDKVHAVTTATTSTIMGATMRINTATAAAVLNATQAPGTPNTYATTRLPTTPTSVRNTPSGTSRSFASPDFFNAPSNDAESVSGRSSSSSSHQLLPPAQSSQVFHVHNSQSTREQLPPDVLAAISAANSATAANLARAGVTQGAHQNAHLLNVSAVNPMRRARHTAVGFGGGQSAHPQYHHSSAFAFRAPGNPHLQSRHAHSSSMNFSSNLAAGQASAGGSNGDTAAAATGIVDLEAAPISTLGHEDSVGTTPEQMRGECVTESVQADTLPAFTRPTSLSLSSRPRKLAPSSNALALEAAAAAAATAAMAAALREEPQEIEQTYGAPTENLAGNHSSVPSTREDDRPGFQFTNSVETRPRYDSVSSTPGLEVPTLSKVMSSPENPSLSGTTNLLHKSSSFDTRHRDSLGDEKACNPERSQEEEPESQPQTSNPPPSGDAPSGPFGFDDDDVPPPPPPPNFQVDNDGNVCPQLECSASLGATSAPGSMGATQATTVVSSDVATLSRRASTTRRGSRLHREVDAPLHPDQMLAPGWAEFVDVSGAKYFYHSASNAASWIRPCAANKHLVQLRPAVRSRRPTALAVAYPTAAADALQMYKQAGGEALYEEEDATTKVGSEYRNDATTPAPDTAANSSCELSELQQE